MRQPAKLGSKPVSRRQKARANPYKRSQNALAIADAQDDDKRGQKSHRLGEIDEGGPSNPWPRKRALEDEEEDGSDVGSDGDGNKWKVGVDSGNDSDIDSDEAFGDSDEERFEGYVFRGSSHFNTQKERKAKGKDHEDEEEEEDLSDEDDGLIDLAAALDQNSDADEDEDEDIFSGSDSESDSATEVGSEKSGKFSALQDLVSSLSTSEPARKRQKLQDGLELQPDSIYAVPTTQKLTLEDMMATVTDPTLRKSLKMIDTSEDTTSKKGQPRKLDVPLPARQQDRINRSVAYEKTNETLGRWAETVTLNRRADHLQFPLPGSTGAPVAQTKKIIGGVAPVTSLEQKIHDLMVESGLAGPVVEEKSEDDDEDDDLETGFEELKANKISLAEVQAKRAELRLARELIFREEKRSKRIKKIKSKSFRRVLRKQNEKENQQSEAALAAAGIETEDPEAFEIRRAEARMRSRHRDSKWAKSAKKSGKTVWDEDVKASMIEMAQRQEELKRRMHGKSIRNDDDSDSSEGDDQSSGDEDAANDLDLLQGDSTAAAPKQSGLMGLKFMQRAQNELQAQNNAEIDGLMRQLNGQAPREEHVLETGRKKYGSAGKPKIQPVAISSKPDVYDSEASVDEAEVEEEVEVVVKQAPVATGNGYKKASRSNEPTESANPWLNAKPEKPAKRKAEVEPSVDSSTTTIQIQTTSKRVQKKASSNAEILVDPKAVLKVAKSGSKASKGQALIKAKISAKSVVLQPEDVSDDGSDSDQERAEGLQISRDELIRRAFAGDDVLAEFIKEKEDIMEEDDEKVVDATLPGWGNWTGDGLSKKEQARNKGRFLVKKEGLKKENRKDAKLDRVIVNEKRIKKNTTYLASALPFPFETRQQYERSLRLPVGPEWTTKETFQTATKPRILLKQGIIDPISRPVL